MQDFVTLTCPSCGGKLQITPDIDRFACAHCGNEHVVRRAGGVVALTPVVEEIRQVRTGVDRTASELAIQRLSSEIRELENEKQQIRSDPWDVHDIYFGCFVGIVIGIVALVVFGVLLGEVAGFTAAIVAWIAGYAWGWQQKLKKQKEEFAAIDQEIARKRNELAKHKRIVSTY